MTLPKTLQLLAATDYSKSQVDVILGADIYEDIALDNKFKSKGGLNFRITEFGWVISGRVAEGVESDSHLNHIATESNEFNVKKFWELENIPFQSKLTKEEKFCEDLFNATTRRDPDDGRSIDQFLFKENSKKLEDSLEQAKTRFYSIEIRL